jgi:hypothetical protein
VFEERDEFVCEFGIRPGIYDVRVEAATFSECRRRCALDVWPATSERINERTASIAGKL